MKWSKILNSKVLLGSFNFIFFICGFTLLLFGFLLLCDSPRVLLSRLLTSPDNDAPQPPFYYLALGLVGGGLIMCAGGGIGCWATYAQGYFILTMYFILVLGVILCQCAACVLIVVWPNCVGLQNVRGGAVGALQASYGVPENEQFTAAMDLAQTTFECCGMTDGRNYDMSLWQLRRLGPRDLIVPLTCCVQDSKQISYLDPKPINQSLCEELLPEQFLPYRYNQGCLTKVEIWYQQQYIIFLGILLFMALCEFGVLSSIVLACSRVRKNKGESKIFQIKLKNNKDEQSIYQNKIATDQPIVHKYVQPNNFYSPRTRNPRIFHTKPNEMA